MRHPPILESAGKSAQSTVWRGEEDTRAFAERLSARPAIANAFIELRGELGAGKTTFTRHLLHALGVIGRIKSPTYTVVETYKVAWQQRSDEKLSDGEVARNEEDELAIWHFDFYRFADPREWEDAGFRDIFASPGLKLAEWPQKAGALLPPADLVIELEILEDATRQVRLTAQSAAGRELME